MRFEQRGILHPLFKLIGSSDGWINPVTDPGSEDVATLLQLSCARQSRSDVAIWRIKVT